MGTVAALATVVLASAVPAELLVELLVLDTPRLHQLVLLLELLVLDTPRLHQLVLLLELLVLESSHQ